MCYLIVGPIQSCILKYTMEAFPTILKLVKKIEELDFQSMIQYRYKKIRPSKIILRRRDEIETYQQREQLDEMDQVTVAITERRISTISTVSDIQHGRIMTDKSVLERKFSANPVINKLARKGYDHLSKLWIVIIIVMGLVAIGIVFYNAIISNDLKYEVKLVLMCCYLVFPVITTWFCLVLIEHHRNMYKVLDRLRDEAFNCKENNILKDITTYINTLQKLFLNLSENIFEFTLGINFAIFTIISVASTYEILQNLHILQSEDYDYEFSSIVYVFPLAICIVHIYAVCKRTHDLKNRAYDHLRIRLKEMLPVLLMEGEDKLFKKVEILYKNLKDWPPQVRIYGGFQINYRILVAIVFFSFAYARTFNRINRRLGEENTTCSC
ncbi:unnamed protein product [Meganyctiphanes norvegica]|uniref:Gustatory receptor n=1 Tax=Meganyctiphanes norvegica TaxID=48144 RepID=A0AAV2QCI8_MEGNR